MLPAVLAAHGVAAGSSGGGKGVAAVAVVATSGSGSEHPPVHPSLIME